MYARSFGAMRVSVPVIGQGTWHIDSSDRTDAIRALRAGIDAGMTHIDTAEMYGDAEAIVAAAIADCREEVFLVSKVVPGNATRRGVARACEASLRRLRTDRLDSYLLHWPGQHPSRRRSRASRICAGRARSCPGVSAISTSRISTAPSPSRGRTGSPAIRSSTI